MQMQPVDPSVPRTPLPLDADDVATACVLCSHNCGLAGHVWMPNGFGMHFPGVEGLVGANQNELTDVADRDPFTDIPHHRAVACRVERGGRPETRPGPRATVA